MKIRRRLFGATLCVIVAGFCAVVFNNNQVSASYNVWSTSISNFGDYTDTTYGSSTRGKVINDVLRMRQYLKNNWSSYLLYYNGNKVIYKNGSGVWQTATITTSYYAQTYGSPNYGGKPNCAWVKTPTFIFYVAFVGATGDGNTGSPMNASSPCGAPGLGQVIISPPYSDIPTASLIYDIDAGHAVDDNQRVTFHDNGLSSGINEVIVPSGYSAAYDIDKYSSSVRLRSKNKQCIDSTHWDGQDVNDARLCRALVLARGQLVVSSELTKNGGIGFQSNMYTQYRTLTFNPDGGTVNENNGDSGFIWSHKSGNNLLREYDQNAYSYGYPTPTRSGYDFVGWFSGSSQYTGYTMSGDLTLTAKWVRWDILLDTTMKKNGTTVSSTTATIGDVITWTHTARQIGPSVTNASSSFYEDHTGSIVTGSSTVYSWSAYPNNSYLSSFASGRGVDSGYVSIRTETRTISPTDVGKTLCSRLRATRVSSSHTSPGYSTSRCVTVPYNFTISPQTKIVQSDSGYSNSGGTFSGSNETKIGRPYPSKLSHATWSHRLIQNGPTITNAAIGFQSQYSTSFGSASAPYYRNMQTLAAGSGQGTTTYTGNGVYSSQGYTEWRRFEQSDVGLNFCSTLYANRYNQNGGNANSGQHCVQVPYHYPGCYETSCSSTQRQPCMDDATGTVCSQACKSTLNCDNNTKIRTDMGLLPETNLALGTGPEVTLDGDIGFTYDITNFGPTKAVSITARVYVFTLGHDQQTSARTEIMERNAAWSNWTTVGCTSSTIVGRGIGAGKKCESAFTSPYSTNFPSPRYSGSNGTSIQVGFGNSGHSNCTQTTNNKCRLGTYTISDITSYDPNAGPGDKICSYMAVDRWSAFNGSIVSSVLSSVVKCVTIIKQPQIQLRGADSYSGAGWFGNASHFASTSGFISFNSNLLRRGSWSQYGLLAASDIVNFGSAGYTMSGANRTTGCKLLFSNAWTSSGSGRGPGGNNCSDSTIFGNVNAIGGGFYKNSAGLIDLYPKTIRLPDNRIASYGGSTIPAGYSTPVYVGTTTPRVINLNALSSGSYFHYGDAIIDSNEVIASGKRIFLFVTGTLTIRSDIKIPGIAPSTNTYTQLGQIPIITIASGSNMYVNNNVNTITGTYITNRAFYSCTNGSAPYPNTSNAFGETQPAGTCNRRLVVNGAIIVRDKLRFQRTFGGGATNSTVASCLNAFVDVATTCNQYDVTPSEIINYTPNLFLTPYVLRTDGSTNTINWTTVSQKTLPVRL